MKYLAIIFDLFGTLVDNFSSRGYENALIQMASALSLPPDKFSRVWFSSARAHQAGTHQSLGGKIEYICSELGTQIERRKINQAKKIRIDYIRHVMEPRPDAVEVLSCLREQGYKTGLISDCSQEIPIIWLETPLACLIDATVFSCLVGFKKPDRRMYELVAERLDVPLDRCLYIGDGGSQELSGAIRVGMHPVLIRLDAESMEKHLVSREEWKGLKIRSLREVLAVVARE